MYEVRVIDRLSEEVISRTTVKSHADALLAEDVITNRLTVGRDNPEQFFDDEKHYTVIDEVSRVTPR